MKKLIAWLAPLALVASVAMVGCNKAADEDGGLKTTKPTDNASAAAQDAGGAPPVTDAPKPGKGQMPNSPVTPPPGG